eukprot:TRINITY_DN2249_c0_g1_i1.p1 TRINITY_DN2249_c0_g1~~TRINITY_DN2249_c0_g1_i1.p1  ORF type:complete len:1045 (+),score=329.74 TRINITY_DN2249_c0_g1_i1:78-3137(+)
MDPVIAEWRRLPLHEQEQRAFFTDVRAAASVARRGATVLALEDDGGGSTAPRSERYFAPRHAAAERNRYLTRERLAPALQPPRKRPRRFDTLRDPAEERRKRGALPGVILFPSEEDGGSSSGSSGVRRGPPQESADDAERRRAAAYARRLRETPEDAALWDEYARWQERICGGRGVQQQRRAACERMLAVYDRALDHNPGSADLWRAMATCAAEHLPAEEVDDVWDAALRRAPGSAALWSDFLRYRKSLFSSCSYSEIRKLHSRAARRVVAAKHAVLGAAGLPQDEQALRLWELELGAVRLVAAAAAFEEQCGYRERAVALLQAMIEANCFAPPGLATWRDKMDALEKFWESEAPRVGEEGSQTWAAWHAQQQQTGPHAPPPQPPPGAAAPGGGGAGNGGDGGGGASEGGTEPELSCAPRTLPIEAYTEWAEMQGAREAADWRPLRPLKDARLGRADPDKVVLFDDIEGLLVPVYEPGHKHLLFQLALELAGVPVLYTQRAVTDPVAEDALRRRDVDSLLSVFGQSSWAERLEWRPCSVRPGMSQFVLHLLDAAQAAFPGDPLWGLLRLDVRAETDPTGALADAKAMLQKPQHRSDLRLWTFYASLLRRAKQPRQAERVFEVVLTDGVRRGQRAEGQQGLVASLCRQYAELLMLGAAGPATDAAALRNRVAHLCCCAAEGRYERLSAEPVPPARMLAARALLTQGRDRLRAGAGADGTQAGFADAELAFCAALLELASRGYEAADAVMRAAALAADRAPPAANAAPGADDMLRQHLWVLRARLAHFAAPLGAPAPPGAVVRALREAAERYPTHPQLVALYAARQLACAGGAHRLRRFFAAALSSTQRSPLVALYAVHCEIALCPSTTAARVRRLLLAAFRSADCRSCPGLWQLGLRFERAEAAADGCLLDDVAALRRETAAAFERGERLAERRRLERRLAAKERGLERARRAFYQAVGEVPHSVALWTEGVRLLSAALDPDEVQDAVDIMLEKGLHLRAFVEEVAPPPPTPQGTPAAAG